MISTALHFCDLPKSHHLTLIMRGESKINAIKKHSIKVLTIAPQKLPTSSKTRKVGAGEMAQELKSTGHSSKRPGFNSSIHLNSSSRISTTLFWPPSTLYKCRTLTFRQNTQNRLFFFLNYKNTKKKLSQKRPQPRGGRGERASRCDVMSWETTVSTPDFT